MVLLAGGEDRRRDCHTRRSLRKSTEHIARIDTGGLRSFCLTLGSVLYIGACTSRQLETRWSA